MSGQAAFDKPVRPAALCILGAAGKKELNGIGEEHDDMSDEEGDRIEDEGEFAAPDWRVRAGPRNKPTQREREEHEATHMPFRDWCAHCMMGRGRTHHHIAKQKSEDESRRPIIAMDYFFMKMEATPSAQSIPEESVTCVAVKEDRHQNIMSSVALKKGVEEPWAVERVAKFIDLLGYREITLKSDTEPAIIAFRNRVAALCKAEVTTEDAVKGDKESNGLIENAVMLLRGIIRTIKCHIESRTQESLGDESPVIPWLVEHAGCILSRCQKGRDGKTPFERMHGKKPPQEFVPFGEKVLARRVTTEPRNRMNPRYQYGVWLGMRNNSAECFIGNADGVFRAREIRRLEPQDRWDKEAINNVIGVPWRMTDGKWTVDRPEVRVDPIPIPPLPFEGARIQRERITKKDIDAKAAMPSKTTKEQSSERGIGTIGCQGCNAIKDNKRAQAHSDRCRLRIEECLRNTPHGAERLDRRVPEGLCQFFKQFYDRHAGIRY